MKKKIFFIAPDITGQVKIGEKGGNDTPQARCLYVYIILVHMCMSFI